LLNWEILAPVNFNTFAFDFLPEKLGLDDTNRFNESWMNSVNATGLLSSHTNGWKIFISMGNWTGLTSRKNIFKMLGSFTT